MSTWRSRLRALTAIPLWVAASGCAPDPVERPHIVLIVLDTVRADHIASYGYDRPTSPHLDELAARGLRFANASSTSSWTVPAHASLFTGLYSIDHGATQEHPRLDRGTPTLAEILSGYGYETLGVSANPLVSAVTGLQRGFTQFEGTWEQAGALPEDPAQHPNLLAVRAQLEARESGRPFFLFVNFMEAHSPYRSRERIRSRFLRPAHDPAVVTSATTRSAVDFYLSPGSVVSAELEVLRDLYDAAIAEADGLVGVVVDELERRGELSDTLLVVTSDHGENFGDHGHFRHIFNLHHSLVRIPLILLPPGDAAPAGVRDDAVSLVDVFTTLLTAAGAAAAPASERYPGRDLLGSADSAGPADGVAVFAEYYFPLQALGLFPAPLVADHPEVFAPYQRRLRSIETRGLRLIRASPGGDQLYDLRADSGERRDLRGEAGLGAEQQQLAQRLEAFVARRGEPRPLPAWRPGREAGRAFGELDHETEAHLRELGYVAE